MRKVSIGDVTSRGVVIRVPRDEAPAPGDYGLEHDGVRVTNVNPTYKPMEGYAQDFGDPILDPTPEAMAVASYRGASPYGITSGTDPEILAFKADGSLVPAWMFLPSKETPVVALDEEIGDWPYELYWDGAQAELRTLRGFSCHEIMASTVRKALLRMNTLLQGISPGATLRPQDTVALEPELLDSSLDVHVDLGCSPSLNAYGMPAPVIHNPRKLRTRFAGCHAHFGIGNLGASGLPAWFPEGTVVMMDKIAGLGLCALGRGLEDPVRRKYYGRAGEYRRPHPHRLEYRTPSNFLLWDPQIFHLGFDLMRAAFTLGLVYDGRKFPLPDAKDIIMACDADAAYAQIATYEPMFRKILKGMYPGVRGTQGHGITRALEAFKTGWKPTQSLVQAWSRTAPLYWYQKPA